MAAAERILSAGQLQRRISSRLVEVSPAAYLSHARRLVNANLFFAVAGFILVELADDIVSSLTREAVSLGPVEMPTEKDLKEILPDVDSLVSATDAVGQVYLAVFERTSIWTIVGLRLAHLLTSILWRSPVEAGVYTAVFGAMRESEALQRSAMGSGPGVLRARAAFSHFRDLPLWLGIAKLVTVLQTIDFFNWMALLYIPVFLSRSPSVVVVASLLYLSTSSLLSLGTGFAIPFLVEHPHLGVRNCILLSWRLMQQHLCGFLGMMLYFGCWVLFGLLLCVVGVLYTIPTAFIATAFCFHHLVGVQGYSLALTPEQESANGLRAAVAAASADNAVRGGEERVPLTETDQQQEDSIEHDDGAVVVQLGTVSGEHVTYEEDRPQHRDDVEMQTIHS